MDIEKIKSLIRLANNNPNDNEANLAARKACKVLAENNFQIFSSRSNPTTWNDVKRSTEPDFRSTPYSGFNPFEELFREARKRGYDPYANPYKTVFENECVECHTKVIVPENKYHKYWTCSNCLRKARENRPKQKPDPPKPKSAWETYEYDFVGVDWQPFTSTPPNTGPRPEKKVRKCSKCGREVETRRVTTIFTCNVCEWTAYQKQKTEIPNCRRCKKPINTYVALTDSWSCLCGSSVITAIEAAARGIKFT